MDPELAQVGSVRLWYYGLAYAIGLLAIHFWVYLRRERLGYDRRDVALFSLFLAGGVLLGGRLFDVALYEWFYYREHPWQILRLWEGGMATHGVLVGAVVGAVIFCRLRKKSFLAVADEVVVPGAVLMALGRVGNHINGEVYGSVTGLPWAVRFPYAEGCRHPVALYDGAKNLLIVPILLSVRSINLRRYGRLPRGLLLGHFVFWYGALRLFVDVFREYDSYWLGAGRGQYFNLLMAAAGLAIILATRRYTGRRTGTGLAAKRPVREDVSPSWAPAIFFYALVVLCLAIPSGWTQQVLQGFEVRAGEPPPGIGCGGSREEAVRYGAVGDAGTSPVREKLRSQVAREAQKSALGGGVVVIGDHGVVYQVGEDADDLTPSGLVHPRRDGLGAVKGAPQSPELMEVVIPPYVREVLARDRIEPVVGEGVVDEYVDGAERVVCRPDHAVDRLFVGDVGAVGYGLGPRSPETSLSPRRLPGWRRSRARPCLPEHP